jgi:hypothetical protein
MLRSVHLRSVRRLLVTASVVPSSPILFTLMKEALSSSETSVLTRAAWCNTPEDTILHSHRRENPKSYNIILNYPCFQNNQWHKILFQDWTYDESKESDRHAVSNPAAQLWSPGTQGPSSKQDKEQGADWSTHNGEVSGSRVWPVLQQ